MRLGPYEVAPDEVDVLLPEDELPLPLLLPEEPLPDFWVDIPVAAELDCETRAVMPLAIVEVV